VNPYEARQAVLDAVGELRGSPVDRLLGEFARHVQEHTERRLLAWRDDAPTTYRGYKQPGAAPRHYMPDDVVVDGDWLDSELRDLAWLREKMLPAGPEGSGVQRDGAATDRPAVAATEDTDSPSSPARQGCCAKCEAALAAGFRPSRREGTANA